MLGGLQLLKYAYDIMDERVSMLVGDERKGAKFGQIVQSLL